ncbi:MAG: hypothetical protein NTY19_43685, partial [Planctomycetota bacterium]|nr:hypothetical protein [Planctomycetota bacterium]
MLTAGTGWVEFNANIGAIRPLGALTVTRADAGVVFGGKDTADDVAGDHGPVNFVTLVGDAAETAGLTALILGCQDILGSIVFNGGTAAPGDKLTIQTTSDAVRINGAVTLSTDVRIDTDAIDTDDLTTSLTGANILFTNDASINSQANAGNTDTEANSLVLDAGVASVLFNEDIGNGANGPLGRVIVEEADTSVVFGEADTEPLTPDQTDGGPVNLVTLVGDAAETAGLTALNLGSLDIIGSIVFNGGTMMAGDKLTIQTTSDQLRFNGAVRLDSDVLISTDETNTDDATVATSVTGANILFTNDASIDSFASEANSLTLDAGVASVFFNED